MEEHVNEYEISVRKRVKEAEKVLKKVKDKGTMEVLRMLYSLKNDYIYLEEHEKAVEKCSLIIEYMTEGITRYNRLTKAEAMSILLSAYDEKARHGDLRSFMIAMEWNRPLEKQFFIPRRRVLEKHGLIQDFQDLIDGKLDILIVNLPPRIGKSTLSLFVLALMCAMNPDLSILGNGHSASLTVSFYNEIMNLFTSEEYRFKTIFPELNIVNKSAEYNFIDFNTPKRFHTIMFRSVDGGTTGLAEASNLLYCDDLVKDVETANNPDRLEKLFDTYTSTIKDRKVMKKCKDGEYRICPELHVGTPWSNQDVMGRLISYYKEMDNGLRIRIKQVPCYDENGESNFQYDYGKGFSTQYYKDMELTEDPVIFSAKYLMKCIEREGRPFTKDALNYYYSLPEGKPDNIVAYNDVSFGGNDYMSMPIGYVYGNEVYIEDVLYVNNCDPDESRPLVCQKIIENKVEHAGFEQNNGGKLYSDFIELDLRKKGVRCHISSHPAPTNKSKRDRILSCQSEIKGIATQLNTYKIYFRAESIRKHDNMYNEFMRDLHNWSQNTGTIQKTQQDGAPDSLAGLVTNILDGTVGKVTSTFSRKDLGI